MTSGSSEYNLGPVTMIPEGEGRVFRAGYVDVAVFRTKEGRLYATQALCPHRAGPLADGIIGAGKVICPLHAYKFDLETGCALGNECQTLVIYPVSLSEAGDIVLKHL